MRQHAGRVNRVWLFLLGLVMLLAAGLGALLASGRYAEAGDAVGLVLLPVSGGDPVLSGLDATSTAVRIGFAAIGVVLVVLGLTWLIAQVPRKNEAPPYRFDTDTVRGITTCEPRVICRAVESAAGEIEDVIAASAVLRGSRSAPELTLQLTVSDEADLGSVMAELTGRVAPDLAVSLDAPLALLAVSVEVEHARRSTSRVLL